MYGLHIKYLDEKYGGMAGMQGLEPQLYAPEAYVLPISRHPSQDTIIQSS